MVSKVVDKAANKAADNAPKATNNAPPKVASNAKPHKGNSASSPHKAAASKIWTMTYPFDVHAHKEVTISHQL